MAASMKCTCLMFSRRICSFTRRFSTLKGSKAFRNSTVRGSLMVSAAFAKLSTESNNDNKLEEPDPVTLSREYLIKSASISTAEQAGILLTQTALALNQAETEYVEAIFALVVLMEYKLKVLGDPTEEARIWDLIVQTRALVQKKKTKKHDLEMILTSAQNMLNIAAETAYLTGADLVGSCAGERLYKVEQYLKPAQRESEDAETRLREAEVKTVNVEGKYAEELEKEKAAAALEEEKLNAEQNSGTTKEENGQKAEDNEGNLKSDNSEKAEEESVVLNTYEYKDNAKEI